MKNDVHGYGDYQKKPKQTKTKTNPSKNCLSVLKIACDLVTYSDRHTQSSQKCKRSGAEGRRECCVWTESASFMEPL